MSTVRLLASLRISYSVLALAAHEAKIDLLARSCI
jgi:hypothetical protein